MKVLVCAGANVNHFGKDGASALIFVSQMGHIQVVQALIEAQVDVNYAVPANILMPENEGMTALIFASGNRHSVMVKALLDAKEGRNS